MAGEGFNTIFELAVEQHGCFTTAQARTAGVRPSAIVMMERRGRIQRLSRGVYRLLQFPFSPFAQYAEAMLWPSGMIGTISHESALALYEVSDVSPARVHITLPVSFRVRRQIPPHLVIHHADLGEDDVQEHEGIRVTTPRRTLLDCAKAHLGNELLGQAIDGFLKQGFITARDAVSSRAELLSS
jgi:predicted transcriptional regulator of viral defense system